MAITMKYRPVPISKVVDETPDRPQGDTTENPIPTPKEISNSVSAHDAAAPARTAPQDTPDPEGSTNSSADVRDSVDSILLSWQFLLRKYAGGTKVPRLMSWAETSKNCPASIIPVVAGCHPANAPIN